LRRRWRPLYTPPRLGSGYEDSGAEQQMFDLKRGGTAMQTTRKVAPGQKGAKKLLEQYGARLLCVSYRYDAAQGKRYKTVELIVEEAPWSPPARLPKERLIGVCITFQEVELQRQVKRTGTKWNPTRRLWEMRYDQALALGLKD
jgi:hypothetical protein